MKPQYKELFIGIIFSLVTTLFILRNILFINGAIIYRDFTFSLDINNIIHIFYSSVWNDQTGVINLESIKWVFSLPFFLPAIYLNNSILFQKMNFFEIFFFGFLNMFLLMNFILNMDKSFNKISVCHKYLVSSISAIIFILNPGFINMLPDFALIFGFTFFPILFVAYIRHLEESKFSYLFIVLILLLIISLKIHLIFFSIIFLCLWLIFDLLNMPNPKKIKNFLLLFFLFIILSSYWLFPYVVSSKAKSVTPSYILTREEIDMLGKNDISNSIRFLGGFWPPVVFVPPSDNDYIKTMWFIASFILPILSIIGIVLNRHNRFALFFSSILAISIILVYIPSSLPKISEFIIFKAPIISNSNFNWILRVPGKWYTFIFFSYSVLSGFAIMKILYICQKARLNRLYYLIIIIVLSSFLFYSWTSLTGDFGGGFHPSKIPSEIYKANEFLKKDEGQFKVIWLPTISGRDLTWNKKTTPEIYPMSSNKPSYDGAILTSHNGDIMNNPFNYKYYSSLDAKYIIIHNDIIGAEEETSKLISSLQSINIFPIMQEGFITIFKIPYADHINIPRQNIVLSGDMKKFSVLNSLDSFNTINSSLFFLDQGTLKNKSDYVKNADIVINDDKLIYSLIDNKYIINTFDSTIHNDPSKVWSKAATNDPLHGEWHPYLEYRGIDNYDLDYGKGIVHTWSNNIIDESINPSEKDLLNSYNFERDLEGWSGNAEDIQSVKLDNGSYSGKYSLQSELNESKSGWKTIDSPMIPANYQVPYRWELYIKGERASSVHIKMVEYDIDKKIISTKYVADIGTGMFNWKKISFDYRPENKGIVYTQLQIWHGHETTQTLPNKLWIDDVKVYNLTEYIKPVTIDMDLNVDKDDSYELFVRYFKNKDGGRINISLDGKMLKRINTRDQLNKFVWEKLDRLYLKKGKYKLTLTNDDGFNAVNIFALIPTKEYQEMEAKIESLTEGKRLINIFEAESDLYRTDTNISKKYGGEASNGEVLEFNNTSRAWQIISIMRSDNYKIALKVNGSFNIKVDETKYNVSSDLSDFAYIGPIYLNKGDHKIEIMQNNKTNNSDLDVIWLYSINKKDEKLDDIFTVNEIPATVSNHTKIGHTIYKTEINATKPFMLSFAESYDPLWTVKIVKINGKPIESEIIRPIPLYSVINGFWINQTGDLDIIIEYEPQKWFYIGVAVSTITLVMCIAYLIYDWIKKKDAIENKR
ncbi:Uncharacterised protein [uncultured archaeon]|nr:Uncharacterised protein [uncultured archaeon]